MGARSWFVVAALLLPAAMALASAPVDIELWVGERARLRPGLVQQVLNLDPDLCAGDPGAKVAVARSHRLRRAPPERSASCRTVQPETKAWHMVSRGAQALGLVRWEDAQKGTAVRGTLPYMTSDAAASERHR